MAREEQINDAAEKALEKYDIYGRCQDPHQVFTDAFCEGAEWANKDAIKRLKIVYADLLSAKGFDIGSINEELQRLNRELTNKTPL